MTYVYLRACRHIFIVGVFDYANEMEDPTTMYHLFRENVVLYLESGMVESLEEYVADWRKGFSFFKGCQWD